MLIFRSELMILLGPMLLWELVKEKLKMDEVRKREREKLVLRTKMSTCFQPIFLALCVQNNDCQRLKAIKCTEHYPYSMFKESTFLKHTDAYNVFQ